MHVKQISVFIENSNGKLSDITRLLANSNINLMCMSIADTASFGILRFITPDLENANRVLEENGYTTCINHVLAVPVEDKPGGLADILEVLFKGGIGVEYMYSFNQGVDGKALIALRVSDYRLGQKVLEENGIRIITREELDKLC